MEDEDIGCLISVAILIILLFAIFAFYSHVQNNLFVQILTIAVSALVVFTIFWKVGKKSSYTRKVLCLLIMYVCLIVLFAVLYAISYWKSSSTAFRVSEDILSGQLKTDLKRHIAEVNDKEVKISLTSLMLNQQAAILNALKFPDGNAGFAEFRDGAYREYSNKVMLSPSFYFTCFRRDVLTSLEDKPFVKFATNDKTILKITDDKEEVVYFDIPISSLIVGEANPEKRLGRKILEAKSETDLRQVLEEFLVDMKRILNEQDQAARNIIQNKPELEMTHFIYFSAAIMTTVGSNDIIPNNWLARYIVVVQALFAVFYVAYALHLFWPEPKVRVDISSGNSDLSAQSWSSKT